MQTPISFALGILLDCDTIEKAHKAARKYIKHLEGAQSSKPPAAFIPVAQITAQAPSTQRLLEQHGLAAPPPPITTSIIARPVGGEVITGNGTRGPKKW